MISFFRKKDTNPPLSPAPEKIPQTDPNNLSAILESMSEGVLVIDVKEKIIVANEAIANFLNTEVTQLKGRYYWEIFRDMEINAMLKNSLHNKQRAAREHSLLLSGAIFEIQVSPVFEASEFRGVVAVFHDVTKLKELEKMRTEFVANVSHELKTPLTSVIGYVETLREGAAEDPETRKQFLAIIEDNATKLYALIDQILSLSQIESGQQLMEFKNMDVCEFIDSLIPMFASQALKMKVTLSCEYEKKPLFVRSDRKSLEVILSNLIDNAIKYNKIGGWVRIQVSETAGGNIVVKINDSGLGIPSQDLPRIFERFYRVDKSRTRETGGSGLGLAIAKHIAEKNFIKIDVESRLSEGSCFSLHFTR